MSCTVDAPTGHLKHLVQDLVHDVPGSELVAERYMWRSAQQFFRESARWMVRLSIPAAKITTITIPNLEVIKVMQVQYENGFLKERTLSNELDTDKRFINSMPNVLELTFEPTKSIDIIVSVTLAENNYLVEQTLLTRYRDSIITGATSMLLMVDRKEYTNQNRAVVEREKFMNLIENAWAHAHQFLGFCRKYYGERQHYTHCCYGDDAAQTTAYPDPRYDKLVLDYKELRVLLGTQTSKLSGQNSTLNDVALRYLALKKTQDYHSRLLIDLPKEHYGQGTLVEMLGQNTNIRLWDCIDDNENNGLWLRQNGSWYGPQSVQSLQPEHYGTGSLTLMLASTSTVTIWNCTDDDENNGLWLRQNGNWNGPESVQSLNPEHYGTGTLIEMLASVPTVTIWNCTDDDQNNGIWLKQNGNWNGPE